MNNTCTMFWVKLIWGVKTEISSWLTWCRLSIAWSIKVRFHWAAARLKWYIKFSKKWQSSELKVFQTLSLDLPLKNKWLTKAKGMQELKSWTRLEQLDRSELQQLTVAPLEVKTSWPWILSFTLSLASCPDIWTSKLLTMRVKNQMKNSSFNWWTHTLAVTWKALMSVPQFWFLITMEIVVQPVNKRRSARSWTTDAEWMAKLEPDVSTHWRNTTSTSEIWASSSVSLIRGNGQGPQIAKSSCAWAHLSSTYPE